MRKNNGLSVLNRLNIAQGHLKKVIRMVETGQYCIDILHQSQAVQASLKEIDNLILINHLNTCVVDAIKKGKSKKVISEIMTVFNRKK